MMEQNQEITIKKQDSTLNNKFHFKVAQEIYKIKYTNNYKKDEKVPEPKE